MGTPYKMKGSPMQRNFGVGSPVRQTDKEKKAKLIKEGMSNMSKEELQNVAKRNINKGVRLQHVNLYNPGDNARVDSVRSSMEQLGLQKYLKKQDQQKHQFNTIKFNLIHGIQSSKKPGLDTSKQNKTNLEQPYSKKIQTDVYGDLFVDESAPNSKVGGVNITKKDADRLYRESGKKKKYDYRGKTNY